MFLVRDAALVLAGRVTRMFVSGAVSVVLVLHLAELGFGGPAIGLLLSLTLAGDALLSMWLTTRADRYGRRRTLVVGAALVAAAGWAFALSDSFVWLSVAAFGGVISPAGKEAGPFLAVEQSALAEVGPAARRTHTFAWYQFAGSLASAAGALAAGLAASWWQQQGASAAESYRLVFAAYGAGGLVMLGLASRLSAAIEPPIGRDASVRRRLGLHRSTRTIAMLSSLFALDAFAGGLIVQSVIAYWLAVRFGVDTATVGTLVFGMGVLAACSAPASAWIASRLGLIRTMVFTHVPSNVLLCLLPFAPGFGAASVLLLLRASVSQMDVPTRQSYVVAVVDPDERSAAAGITSVSRSVGAAGGPALGGVLMAWWVGAPLLAAGIIKLAYDALVYIGFRHLRPPEERG